MCSDLPASTKQAFFFLLISQPTGCQVTVLGEGAVDTKKGAERWEVGGFQGSKISRRDQTPPPPTAPALGQGRQELGFGAQSVSV